jgi:fatty-acyl-CoA synthase
VGGWNYADVWEAIAAVDPDAPAQVQGGRRLSWGDLDARADGVATAMLAAGADQQDKVALYLHNCPEYLETVFAALKVGLVPVNTNYRYRDDELVYLWDNADAVAVVFHSAFTQRIEDLLDRVPRVRSWLWVDDGSGPCPDWASPYEEAATAKAARPAAPWGRSGDDVIMIYTGGTTGIPKGVMWRQDDVYRAFNSQGDPAEPDLGAVAARVTSQPRPVGVPACPQMHGTGFLFSLTIANQGGCVVTLESRRFDAAELFDAVERQRVTAMAIVGDAFARPMVEALDADPGRWDLSSVALVASSGVMWSAPVKDALSRHLPGALLADLLGSTEAHGLGSSVSSASRPATTAAFRPGDHAFVVTEDGRRVEPGSGEIGLLAVRGYVPLGYYKDPEKTARTFPVIDGERCSVPGDWATVEADGTIALLGRGSVCINTGGEKVFPEEVEEALKTHPAVRDATVVGVPDARFGEAVCAAVELRDETSAAEAELMDHVKTRLAGYKAPRHVVVLDSVGRGPNGKADYAGVRQRVTDLLSPTL